MPPDPPDDADDWSDEEWIAWLEATDPAAPEEEPAGVGPRRGRSGAASLLYAGMLGLHQAIYGAEPDQVTIVAEADGQPDDPEGLEVHLEPDHPEDSTVVVRPWLFDPRPGTRD